MKAKMKSNDFNRLVSATRSFTAKPDNTRPQHTFIRLEFMSTAQIVTAISVDGYRMAVEHAPCSCDEDFIAYIKGSVKLPRSGETVIEVHDRETIIRHDQSIWGFRHPNGEFLNWSAALPGPPAFRIAFNVNYLLDAVKAAKASKFDRSAPVILEFRSPMEPVIIRTNRTDVKMVLPVRIKDQPKEDS